MDEFQHYESHEDKDFEGGEWINGEFYATGQRKGRTQTADERLYGIFAADDSDDEYEGRKGKRRKKEKEDYSKPVGFVSGGITGSSTEKTADVEHAEMDIKPEAQAKEEPSEGEGLGFGGIGSGLGFQPLGGGLGFQAPAQPSSYSSKPPSFAANGKADEEADDLAAHLPTAFGERILQGAQARQRKNRAQEQQRVEERRQSNRSASTSGPSSMPTFANSAVQKMMAGMGYKPGKGLGKTEQGQTTNLTVEKRANLTGLGADRNDTKPKLDMKAKPEQEKPAKAKQQQGSAMNWKKQKAAERRQRQYKTAEEVLAEQGEKASGLPVMQPILDMRGPQARIVTDMEELTAQGQGSVEDDLPMPELQSNLRVMVELAASDIQRLDGKLRHSKDTAVLLDREAKRLKAEAASAKQKVASLKVVLDRVEQAQQAASKLSLADLHHIYSQLQQDHPAEYIMYDLPAIALTQVLPRIFAVMAHASPLVNAQQGYNEIVSWRGLLEVADQANAMYSDISSQGSDPYSTLLSMTVVPGLARAITNSWQPRDPETLLVWLDTWRDALPTNVQILILDTLIFPKINRAVEEWDPLKEAIPVHAWLHPWLPWMGSRLESLYPTIRFRLANALQRWDPSDGSALSLLAPWHKVFDPQDWNNLMAQSILPLLAGALTDRFIINPANQDMQPFYWITSWASVISQGQMVHLLEAHFFPQWHAVLHTWLSNSPNYNEVNNWFLNWKNQMPPELQGNPRIQAQFHGGLEMIVAATEGRPLPIHAMAPPSMDAYQQAASSLPPPSFSRWGGGTVAQETAEPSIIDWAQAFAESNNLPFAPKNRRHEGLQVYGVGLVSVVLDNTKNIMRAQVDGGIWKPVSPEELLAENKRRASGQ